jgi:hypothetical protein
MIVSLTGEEREDRWHHVLRVTLDSHESESGWRGYPVLASSFCIPPPAATMSDTAASATASTQMSAGSATIASLCESCPAM